MALSGRRQPGIRLLLKGTSPLRGFVIDGRHKALDRAARWRYRNGKLTGDFPAVYQDELQHFANRLNDQVLEYRLRGSASFLKFCGVEKIGGATWSLPAVATCPTIDESCADCYALTGFYHANLAAQVGRVMRLEYLQAQIRQDDLGQWVAWMVEALGKLRTSSQDDENGRRFFRWHDSGDVFHEAYARAILDVCRATPEISHWLPTRAVSLMERALAETANYPSNLSITVSCVRAGRYEARQKASVRAIQVMHPEAKVTLTYTDPQPRNAPADWGQFEWIYGPGVAECPVTTSGARERRSCAGCRRCWDQSDTPTVYVVRSA